MQIPSSPVSVVPPLRESTRPVTSRASALGSQPLGPIVAAINAATHRRGLARSIAVARVVVKALYDGDPCGFRSRESKAVSLRRLVEHGAAISPAALYRCLSVHEIWVRTRGHRWPKLGASHYRAVEALVSAEQESWLNRAATLGWSAAHLRQAIRTSGARTADRGGRLPNHPIARFVARVERELTALDRVTVELRVDPAETDSMAQLATSLDRIVARCRAHSARLSAAVAASSPSAPPQRLAPRLPPSRSLSKLG